MIIHKKLKTNKAFTLVEILVVLTIIAILLGIVLVALGGARQDARDTKRKADLEIIRAGLELYKSDCGSYPPGPLTAGSSLAGDNTSAGCLDSNEYISSVPTDPISTQYYQYFREVGNLTYQLGAGLEGGASCSLGCMDCGSAYCNYIVKNP